MDHVRRNIIFEEIFIVNEHSELHDGRPHCESRNIRPHLCYGGDYGLWETMAMWVTMDMWVNMASGRRWLTPPSPVGADG